MGAVTEAACTQLRASSCYTNAMEKEDMAQASDLPPCQLPCKLRKDDPSQVARGRQTHVPGTYGGWGRELIGRYHVDVG